MYDLSDTIKFIDFIEDNTDRDIPDLHWYLYKVITNTDPTQLEFLLPHPFVDEIFSINDVQADVNELFKDDDFFKIEYSLSQDLSYDYNCADRFETYSEEYWDKVLELNSMYYNKLQRLKYEVLCLTDELKREAVTNELKKNLHHIIKVLLNLTVKIIQIIRILKTLSMKIICHQAAIVLESMIKTYHLTSLLQIIYV